MSEHRLPEGVEIRRRIPAEYEEILTEEALAFVAGLQRSFGARRKELLEQRPVRQAEIDGGKMPDFLESTRGVREDPDWRVTEVPDDLQERADCDVVVALFDQTDLHVATVLGNEDVA